MLEVAGLSVAYGKHAALVDVALTSAPARSSPSSAPTAPARRRCSRRSPAWCRPRPARASGSPAATSPALQPHEIVEAGVALVPEGRGMFAELTVAENLLLGAYRAARARRAKRTNLERVLALFPAPAERLSQTVRTMSGGEQQMVAIGRALMSAPDILLLDEPSLGLSPLLCTELFRALVRVRATGVGILLVEQNVKQSLDIADRAYLIETGRIVGEGAAAALKNEPAVQRAYLGAGEIHRAAGDV